MLTRKFSRREVIKMSGAAAVAALLAACQPKVVEVEKIVEKEVTKIVKEVVKETVIVEGTPVTIEKEVTKVVQVEVTRAPAEAVLINWATPAGLGLERTMYTNFSYKFMEENPGIKVKVSFESWGDYMTKLPTMLSAGVTPDVIHMHCSIGPDYAYMGTLLVLNPYMERDNVKPEDFIEVLLDEFRHKGKIYALPKDSAARACYYNKTMFDEAGVEYPKIDWTVQDFARTTVEMTRDNNGYPASDAKFDASKIKQWGCTYNHPTPLDGFGATALINAMGTEWYSDDFKETYVNHPGAIELIETWVDLRCAKHAMPTPGEALGQGDQWRAGLTAMCFGHHSTTFFAKQERVRFEFDCNPMPGGPGGQFVSVGCSAFTVSANAAHKEEGWQLVNFLTSEETQRFIGQQKRWGVQRPAIVQVIEPDDGYPEHFSLCHTDPFKLGEHRIKATGVKFPALQSQVKTIYATELDNLVTCGGGDVAEACERAKKQIDEVLAEVDW